MAAGNRAILTNDRFAQQFVTREYSVGTAGSITSAPTTSIFQVQNAGVVTGFSISTGVNGVDVTNPLSISAALTNVNGTVSVSTTSPAIAKAAGAGVFITTANGAATGVTAAVLSATASARVVAKGDILKVTWTLTRTASPGTEISDATYKVIVTETQDFDPLVS